MGWGFVDLPLGRLGYRFQQPVSGEPVVSRAVDPVTVWRSAGVRVQWWESGFLGKVAW